MSDVPTDLASQLAAQLAALQPKPAAGWSTPATATAVNGIAVPIKVSTPKGEIRLYLQLGPEHATSPDAIMQALQSLDSQGYPLDTWQPRDSGGGWSNGNGGGWNRGGGYSRGGWRR